MLLLLKTSDTPWLILRVLSAISMAVLPVRYRSECAPLWRNSTSEKYVYCYLEGSLLWLNCNDLVYWNQSRCSVSDRKLPILPSLELRFIHRKAYYTSFSAASPRPHIPHRYARIERTTRSRHRDAGVQVIRDSIEVAEDFRMSLFAIPHAPSFLEYNSNLRRNAPSNYIYRCHVLTGIVCHYRCYHISHIII